jgi:hypothetical protein
MTLSIYAKDVPDLEERKVYGGVALDNGDHRIVGHTTREQLNLGLDKRI